MRNPTDPSNHDAAQSLIILEAGVEIMEQGYTPIKSGQTLDFQVYQEVQLNMFSPGERMQSIDTHYQRQAGDE